MGILKSRILYVLMWCLFCAALTLGFLESNAISRFSGASLRFYTPISGQNAFRARQHSVANTAAFWPTFWREDRVELSAGNNTAVVDAILFSGDAALVWPAQYITGSAPSSIDGAGIVVSETLARGLWGSIDIVGKSVYVNCEPRIVRGVFSGSAELALISFHIEDTSQAWTAAELSGGIPNPTRSDAESFAVASGLGRPDYVLMGGTMALSRFMSILPIFIPFIYAAGLFVKFIKNHYPAVGAPIFFAGLILFAVFLPALLNNLPAWLIPTHWSDFAFWSSISAQVSESMREFLSLSPLMRDVELKMHLLRQTGFMIFAIFFGIIVCAYFPGQSGRGVTAAPK